MKSRFYIIMGVLWILVGLFLSAPVLLPQLLASRETQVVAKSTDTSQAIQADEPVISGSPSHIAFPGQNISIDVIPGYYNAQDNTWTLSKDKAHFATTTSEPNNKTGNTFIYGHNRWQVFTGLLSAQPGDQAVVTTSNGHTFTYTLRDIKDTDPTDLSYMQDHKSPILTVQTCSGFWYEHRRMFTFDLIAVDGREV